MAIVWYEHFDLYGGVRDNLLTRGYDNFVNTNSVLSTAARNGSHAFLLAGNSTIQRLRRALPAVADVAGIGCAVERISNGLLDSGAAGLRLEGGGVNYTVIINANNGLTLYSGSTVLATSAPSIMPADSYVWLEMKADSINDTLEVRLNGSPVLSASTAVAPLTHFSIGKTTGAPTARFDDLVVWDGTGTENNNWLGDTFVLVSAPNEDAAINQWVPSTGTTRWSLIDEAAPLDTDFITGNAVDDTQECNTAPVSLPATGAVIAVAVQARALKTDTGASQISIGVASGLSHSSGFSVNLATGAQVFTHIAQRNPDGNIAWTASTAQAARFRARRTA